MIRQSKHATVKAVLSKALFTLLISASAATTQAQSAEVPPSTPGNTSIHYLGMQDDMFVFDVQYLNKNRDKFIVEIREIAGGVLFRKTYDENSFSKKFKIPTDLEGKIKFVIKNVKDNSAEIYEADTTVRVAEDVVITQIN